MKITKVNKSSVDIAKYKSQNTVRRGTDIRGGFEKIAFATDADLD